jgi:hypothetical protein
MSIIRVMVAGTALPSPNISVTTITALSQDQYFTLTAPSSSPSAVQYLQSDLGPLNGGPNFFVSGSTLMCRAGIDPGQNPECFHLAQAAHATCLWLFGLHAKDASCVPCNDTSLTAISSIQALAIGARGFAPAATNACRSRMASKRSTRAL